MKLPKKFDKMSLEQQEDYLVGLLEKANKQTDEIKRLLASVRGGVKVKIIVDERPDLEYVAD